MARKPGVRAKNGYWYSEAGGIGRYLGRIDDISHAEAMSRLWAALADKELRRVNPELRRVHPSFKLNLKLGWTPRSPAAGPVDDRVETNGSRTRFCRCAGCRGSECVARFRTRPR